MGIMKEDEKIQRNGANKNGKRVIKIKILI